MAQPPGSLQLGKIALALFIALFWLAPTPGGAADLEQMQNSTVRIVCRAGGSLSTGSGFVIGTDTVTYVATNEHVAECATKTERQELIILQSRRKAIPASIVWSDARIDLAIIAVKGTLERPAVTLADTSTLAAGEPVRVVGFPAAADKLVESDEIAKPSVTFGNVSLIVTGLNGVHYFQYTAVTVPGNSGGPAFNEAGDVIGIVSMSAVAVISDGRSGVSQVSTGLGAAIDVSELMPHLKTYKVPYEMASAMTGTDITLIVLTGAVVLLLSAGGVLVATSSGRGLLTGDTRAFASSRPSGRIARLRVLGGTLAGTEAPILDRVILGRDPAKSHVVFPESDTSVSRRHCEILFDSAGACFEVRDLGSRNGTFVACGDRAPRRLSPDVPERVDPGDKVQVGSARNSIVLELA